MTQLNLSVAIVDDDITEPTETFTVRTELITTDATMVTIPTDLSSVTIIDDDRKLVVVCCWCTIATNVEKGC